MVTQAVHSQTAVLERTGAFNKIAEVKSITGPELSLNAVDVTHQNSPNAFKEFIGGLRDGGEITIEGNFYPGDTNGQKGLYDDLVAATVQDFRITFPAATGTVWTFKGLVTKFGTGAPLDDALSFSVSIKITAMPTLGITASSNMTAWAGIEETGPAALTHIPTPFAAGTYEYSCDPINTASTWIKMTCTHATAVIKVHNSFNDTWVTLTTAVQSEPMALGLADTITDFIIEIKETDKAPVYYYIRIMRP